MNKRNKQMILLILLFFLVCFNDNYSHSDGVRYDKYIKDKLFNLQWHNKTLNEIEKEIGLQAPFKMRSPSAYDPQWWFIYKYDNLFIELSANTEDPVYLIDSVVRKKYYYTGYFKIYNNNNNDNNDSNTISNSKKNTFVSTYRIPIFEKNCEGNKYSKYFKKYNMKNPISIRDIETSLGLSKPVYVGLPAFIDPLWKFYYEKQNLSITIYGITTIDRDNIGGKIGAKSKTNEFQFSGYWSVRCFK